MTDAGDKSSVFRVTGAVISAAGYYKIPVAWVSGTTTTVGSTLLLLSFSRTGDLGTQGTQGISGASILTTNNNFTGTNYIQGTTNFYGTVEAASSITTRNTTFALANTTATTVNFAGAATTLTIGGGSVGGRTTYIGSNSSALSNNYLILGAYVPLGSSNLQVYGTSEFLHVGPVGNNTLRVVGREDQTGYLQDWQQWGSEENSTVAYISTAGALTLASTISASGLAGSLLTSTVGSALGSASAGTATVPARADHVHPTTGFLKPVSGSTYQALGNIGSEETAGVVTEDRTYYTPFFVPETTTYNQISIRSGSTFSGTGTVRLGIYRETQGKPSTLVLDAGTVSVTAASTVYTATISQSLTAGMYFLAANSQVAAATNTFYISSIGVGTTALFLIGVPGALNATPTAGWSQSSVTGAFANATSLTAVNGLFRMSMRAA